MKSAKEPAEGSRDQQCHAFGARQTDGLGNQFSDDHMQRAQEGKCASKRDGMGKERGGRAKSAGPNRLDDLHKTGLTKRTNSQARQRYTDLHARNDAMQVAEEFFDDAR